MTDPPPQAPDTDAGFNELYTTAWLPMVRLAVLLTGDNSVAEDAVQDAFIILHRKWPTLSPEASPKAFLRGILVNTCRNATRKRATLMRKAPLIAGRDTVASPLEIVGPQRDMWLALQNLPRRMRDVLILRYYGDYSEAEIAAAMGISPGTVKSTASKGLKKLRVQMERSTR